MYRAQLAGQRVLVVLDDAADEAQVRPLLPGSAGCAYPVLRRINTYLLRWVMNKYRNRSTWKKATRTLMEAADRRPRYFAHWAWVKPAVR